MEEKQLGRGYMIRFGLAMLAYMITVLLMPGVLEGMEADNPLRYLVAVTPVVPLIFAFMAYLWFIRQVDEMQRRIQFEAIAFSMGSSIFIMLTLGFLEVAGFPAIGMIWAPFIIIATWGIGSFVASRRY